jgi:hypothetical protein
VVAIKPSIEGVLLEQLERTFGVALGDSALADDATIREELRIDSACGFPYAQTYGPLKEDVLSVETPADLLDTFEHIECFNGCTLKDESRPEGKDARLFRPANIAHVAAGIYLFYDQLQKLSVLSESHRTPYAIGLSTPGVGLSRRWRRHRPFRFHFCGDGSKFDAHVPLAIVSIIREFRKCHLPKEVHHLVDKYYEDAYTGFTLVNGVLVSLLGNPSGHYLTASDNSLILFLCIKMYCMHLGLTEDEYFFSVLGDDLVFSTSSHLVNSRGLQDFLLSLGMPYEMQSEEPLAFEDCTFMGTRPVILQNGEVSHTYLREKTLPRLFWSFRSGNLNPSSLFMQKLCSYVSLFYYDKPAYDLLHRFTFSFAEAFSLKEECYGALESISPHNLHALYNGTEAFSYPYRDVKTLNFQSMQNLISQKYPKLGNTVSGAAWALKALHPAAKIQEELRGIPDADAYPCVIMEYEQVATIGPPDSTTWSADVYGIPHPVHPMSYKTQAGASRSIGGAVNATLVAGATTYSDYTLRFAELCHSYRMLYHSLTIDLDASGLSNNGTIVAAQFPMAIQKQNCSTFVTPSLRTQAHLIDASWVQNQPGKLISQLPGSFSGLATDGVYIPLKLDPTAPWVNTHEMQFVIQSEELSSNNYLTAAGRVLRQPGSTTSSGDAFPFFSSVGSEPPIAPLIPAYGVDAQIFGDIVVPLQQKNMGVCSFYNLNPSAKLTVTMRWGVEMRVPPVSTLAPAMQPSSMVDTLALEAYSDLAASLPWAYPSSYNARGQLLGMIVGAWNRMRPVLGSALSLVPHPAAKVAGRVLNALPSFERPSGSSSTEQKRKRNVTPQVSQTPQQRPQRRRAPASRRPPQGSPRLPPA